MLLHMQIFSSDKDLCEFNHSTNFVFIQKSGTELKRMYFIQESSNFMT